MKCHFFRFQQPSKNGKKTKDAALCESQDAEIWNQEVPIDKKTQVSPVQVSPYAQGRALKNPKFDPQHFQNGQKSSFRSFGAL